MYRLTLVIFLGIFSNYSFAKEKIYSCVNKETNFTTTFLINFGEQCITHLSSFSPNSNQKFTVNKSLNVLTFNQDYLISLTSSNSGDVINLMVFNFVKNNYTNSGHYLKEVRKPYPQLFDCVVN